MEILLRELGKQLNDLTKEFYEKVLPPIDVYEQGNTLVVIVDMPGFDKSSISIRLSSDGVLRIEGKRDVEQAGIKHVAQRPSRMMREIRLPVKVPKDAEVTGKYENGVLTLKIPIEGAAKVKIE
ncbi:MULTISPECIES: archaeal heat shock protein Hsp14 [Metallosphaera]|uniref:Heat shock protein Hsp20 n=3 Tax=Metallosphaera TaxID=41980 RepID=A4YGA0_METS5|nr:MULTISPECIES: archaeal heat shock protein Hsp14 [Metallosphaera]ABP95452.1 heat shock protein Hsp20 [Metallosphaera sedula DSM 5348]AIM27437.1 heat shock protein Hsp20 [Metallosphaera sedula]AKV74312.1 heat-shock protein Hsp20 [Metallosphaera sedula]AKV76551.1 heat-shock protein Hsp20 [Metallosphaera sedula]AKV78803.1 heat-shock protein Hsp20 [Metallosphaera sedula]